MAVGSTFTATLTRDQIVQEAYKKVNALSDGETLTAEQLDTGVKALNSIVRELDGSGKWLWATNPDPTAVTLVAQQWKYTTANSEIPTDMRALDRVMYRDAQGNDWPVKIVTRETFAAISDKITLGDPTHCYLSVEDSILGVGTLHVFPMLATVNDQSVVLGSSGVDHNCIRSHTSVAANKPITGANYTQYWTTETTTAGAAWVTATAYTAPHQLILWYRRPLYEFTAGGDNPDFPPEWTRLLIYRLASDLGDSNTVTLERSQLYMRKSQGAFGSISESLFPQTDDVHNKASDF